MTTDFPFPTSEGPPDDQVGEIGFSDLHDGRYRWRTRLENGTLVTTHATGSSADTYWAGRATHGRRCDQLRRQFGIDTSQY